MTIDIALLYEIADTLTPRMLMGSKWQNAEAEVLAYQTIRACAINHRTHGDAFSWHDRNATAFSGGGLVHNAQGLRKLVQDGSLHQEAYKGSLAPPTNIKKDTEGRPYILRVNMVLLHYVALIIQAATETT